MEIVYDRDKANKLRLYLETAAVLLLTIAAGWMRFEGLGDLSPGINIDESTYAAEINRIVGGEWIGKWSVASLGVPTLQFYVTAPVFMLVDDELWAIRSVSALAGTLVVPATFVLLRRFLPFVPSFVATVMAAFSIYLMLESRIGWPLMLAVLELIAGAAMLVFSIERRAPWLAIIAGVVVGAGMYTHQVFTPYWASAIALSLLVALLHPGLRHRRELYSFAVVCFAVGANMAWFLMFEFDWAADLEHHYGVSASIDPLRWLQRAWDVFMFHRSPISADATDAAPSAPILGGVMQWFFIVGLVIAIGRIRDHRYQMLFVGLLVGMAPSILVPGSEARRLAVGMIFMFAFAGLGLGTLLQLLWTHAGTILGLADGTALTAVRRTGLVVALGVFVAATAFVGHQKLDSWRSQDARWTFNYNLTSLSHFLRDFDQGQTVHFYSDRGGAPHTVMEWVLPEVDVVNGAESNVDGERVLHVDTGTGGTTVVALLESYIGHSPELQAMYPGARLIEQVDEGGQTLWQVLVIEP